MYWGSIILTSLLIITLSVVGSTGKNILKLNLNKPWMPVKRLAKLTQLSLNSSRCLNIHLSDTSVITDKLFHDFVNIYSNTFLLNKRLWECNGYVIISKSVTTIISSMLSVPVEVSENEILIIVNDNVLEPTRLFNITLYGNANVNIVAHNGLWRLTENYLEPRIFKKVRSVNEFGHNRGIANLEGRKLQAAAYFNPPLCYLRTSVERTFKGVSAKFFTATEKPELDGFDLNLFLIIAKRLNATYAIREPPGGFRLGRPNGTHWHGGMISQIRQNEIDIAFTSIWIIETHHRYANLTESISVENIHFLVPRPKPYLSFWALTKPFTPIVWVIIIMMVIAQSLTVNARAHLFPLKVPKRFQSFAMTWIEIMGRLLSTTSLDTNQGFKIIFQLWAMASVLLITAYSSNLAAKLTSPNYEKRIDSPKDFIEANLTWGREGSTPKFQTYFDESDPWASQIKSRFSHETSYEERHKKIMKGNYAIIGKTVNGAYFPENYINSSDLKDYRLMKQPTASFYTTFAVQPWLINSFNKVLLLLRDSGIMAYHLSDVINRRSIAAQRQVLEDYDEKSVHPRVLTLTPLAISFSVLILGLFISTIVFFLELKSFTGPKKSVRQVLLGIKKNRETWNVREGKMIQVFGRKELTGRRVLFLRP